MSTGKTSRNARLPFGARIALAIAVAVLVLIAGVAGPTVRHCYCSIGQCDF